MTIDDDRLDEIEVRPRWKRLAAFGFLCYLAGAATVFRFGPAIGRQMARAGDRMVAMDGETPLRTAREVDLVVQRLVPDAVAAEAARVVGPARVVRR